MGILVIPSIGLLIHIIIKWTRSEDRLDRVIADLDKLIKDKDSTHQAIIQQLADDRKATDRRLRWLEEHLWKRNDQRS